MEKKFFIVFGVVSFIFAFSGLAMACGCGGSRGQSSCHSAAQTGGCGGKQDSCQEQASTSSGHEQHQQQTTGSASAVSKEVVNAGNKICPVMGGKVDGKTTYEFEGKIYNFCCPGCIAEFKNDPQKYIQKVNEELKAS